MPFGGQQVIGWVYKAKDMVSGPVKKMADTITSITAEAKERLESSAVSAEQSNERMLRSTEEVIGVVPAFKNVFKDLAVSGLEVYARGMSKVGEGIQALIGDIKAKGQAMGEAAKQFKQFFVQREFTFTEMAEGAGRLAKVIGVELVKGVKAATSRMQVMAVSIGEVLQDHISMERLLGSIKKMGGIGGVLMGPLAPLLRLFRPLIDLFVKSFTPAIETFSAIVETAFGPFSATLEIIAQNLARKLLPHIKKFVGFAQVLAVQFGVWVAKLLDSGFLDDLIDTVFDMAVELMPTLMEVVNEVGKAFKEVGPPMLKAFLDISKALVPILPDLTKLGITLLRDVFVPALKAIVPILKDDIVPFVKEWMPKIIELVKWLNEAVSDFFGPKFWKYIHDFKILFIEPVKEFFSGVGGKIMDFFTFDETPALTGPNLPIPAKQEGAALVDRPVIAGEAGAEMILPLRADTVERVLMPLIPKIALPGQESVIRVLERIDQKLGGRLQVDGINGESGQGQNDLSTGIGLDGIPAW